MSHSDDVRLFREKIGLTVRQQPSTGTLQEISYFARFVMEELSEFMQASEDGNIVKMADALADLEYITLGMGHCLGFPSDKIFAVVQAANMTKERNTAPTIRGSSPDAVKPIGWVGPEHAIRMILLEAWENTNGN